MTVLLLVTVDTLIIKMEDPLMFCVFLVGMTTCNVICFILFKYQITISPVNQNIINKLNILCIYCLNLINTTQVTLKNTLNTHLY